MKTADLFAETYASLTANKTRSVLTILGIVIGIGSVISMVSIGQGAKNTITESIESLGSNMVMVLPGMQTGSVSQGHGSAQSLTLADAEAIAKEVTTAKAVAPELSIRAQVTAKGTNTNVSITATTPDYAGLKSLDMEAGQFLSAQNVQSMSKVAVLGPTTRDDLFGAGADPVGQTIRIKSINFKVIGVTKAKGGSGFSNADDIIFIPVTTGQQFFSGSDKVNIIDVQAVDEKSMVEMEAQINNLLLDRHNISDPLSADFSTLNMTDIIAAASTVTDTFTLFLAAIAAISLLVGGIGIMNMMLTTVTERTREIGLRKAIGATKGDIQRQFLVEAITLTFLGGVAGVILGWLISFVVSKLAGIATQVSLVSVLLAFGVSAGIGIIFGYYPARRAASFNPIEALRYE